MSEKTWTDILDILQQKVSRPNFITWLKPARFVENRDGLVVIAVPNPYAKSWIEKNALKDLKKLLKDELENFQEVKLIISDKPASLTLDELPLLRATPAEPTEAETLPTERPFDQRYTFENFIVGNNNRLAFAAAQVVAEKPGEAYNPLFIYGGVGLGKTHLMQAIGNEAWRRNPKKKVIYTSCETFTSEFIQSLQTKTVNDFKKKYRTVDVLLIDDIQFLANKEGTQEEFFHTFNILHQANRQIVITSDRVPKEITELEDRLISRLGWGMIADIQTPNFETRVAILQSKAAERNLHIPQEVFDFMATTITSNVRELEGSLIKLSTAAEVEKAPITKDFASRVLRDLVGGGVGRVTAKEVIRAVAKHFDLEVSDILGRKRLREMVYPRQLAMYLLREKLRLSFPQIGEAVGGKDHTTVMHGVSKIEHDLQSDPHVEGDLKDVNYLLTK